MNQLLVVIVLLLCLVESGFVDNGNKAFMGTTLANGRNEALSKFPFIITMEHLVSKAVNQSVSDLQLKSNNRELSYRNQLVDHFKFETFSFDRNQILNPITSLIDSIRFSGFQNISILSVESDLVYGRSKIKFSLPESKYESDYKIKGRHLTENGTFIIRFGKFNGTMDLQLNVENEGHLKAETSYMDFGDIQKEIVFRHMNKSALIKSSLRSYIGEAFSNHLSRSLEAMIENSILEELNRKLGRINIRTLLGDKKYKQFSFFSSILANNANEFTDNMLDNARRDLVRDGYDPLKPGNIEFRKLWFRLGLIEGEVKGLSIIKREGNMVLNMTETGVIDAYGKLKVPYIRGKYSIVGDLFGVDLFEARMYFTVDGLVSYCRSNVTINDGLHVLLIEFKIVELGHIDIEIEGMRGFGWFLSELMDWCINRNLDYIIKVAEQPAGNFLRGLLQNATLELPFFGK